MRKMEKTHRGGEEDDKIVKAMCDDKRKSILR